MGRYLSTYWSPDEGAADHVIGFIARCQTTLDVAMYSLTHDRIAAALVAAHERGVTIRVLMDKTQAGSKYADDELLEAAGIAVRRDTQVGSMHHKFAIDGELALGLGSFNWTASADQRNQENWNVVRLKYVVADYQARFDAIWELNAPPEVT